MSIGPQYQITPDVMVFATYATGYKGQTYDLTTGFNANRAAAGPIKPETSKDKEVGARMGGSVAGMPGASGARRTLV